MKPSNKLRAFLLGSSLLASAPSLFATIYYIDVNNGTAGFGDVNGAWADPTNGTTTNGWSLSSTGGNVTNLVNVDTQLTDDLNFGSTTHNFGTSAARSVVVTGTVEARSLTQGSFNTFATTVSGGTINFDSAATITNNAGAGNFNITSQITGAATSLSLAANGPGNITLTSNTSTYAGVTNVNAGIIVINANNSLGTAVGKTVVASGAQLQFNSTISAVAENFDIAGTGTTATNGALALNNAVTALALSGSITLTDNATITANGSTNVLTMTGGIALGSNTLNIRIGNSAGTATVSTLGITGVNGSIIKNGVGILFLSATSSYSGTTTINAGRVNINAAGALSANTAVTVNGDGVTDGQIFINGAFTHTNDFTISGLGTGTNGNGYGAIRLSNNSLLSGKITLAGDSRIGIVNTSANIAATLSGQITESGGARGLNVFQGSTAGTFTSTLNLANVGTASNYSGNTTVTASTTHDGSMILRLGASNQLPNGLNKGILALDGTTSARLSIFEMNGFSETVNGLSNAVAAGAIIRNTTINSTSVLTVGDADTTSSFSGVITNSGTNAVLALTKVGTGALTLSGTNTYAGATTVSAGTLFVTGALSNSAVTVEANGTIGSNGGAGARTLGSTLAINAGGNLDLTGATIALDSANILTLTGNLTLGGLTFADLIGWDYASAADGTYELINGGFAVTNWGTTANTMETAYNLGGDRRGYFTSGSLNAVLFTVPEPSTTLLGALGFLALLRRRR